MREYATLNVRGELGKDRPKETGEAAWGRQLCPPDQREGGGVVGMMCGGAKCPVICFAHTSVIRRKGG